jgi:hypothetical protein
VKAYVLTTGALFGAVTVAHVARMFVEHRHATEPVYILITLATALLFAWSVRLYRQLPRP